MPRWRGAGVQHGQRLRVAVGVGEEAVGLVAPDAVGHGHGLGGGGGLVEQRGVGQLHAGEVGHHLLEVEHGLEAALADLGLVGRVGGVPARVLQDVAQDHRRGVGAVVAHADQRGGRAVALGQGAQGGQRLGLGAGGRQAPAGGRSRIAAGHHAVDQLVERARADRGQHGRELGVAGADMAVGEGVAGLGLDPGGLAWSGEGLEVGVVGGAVHQAPTSPASATLSLKNQPSLSAPRLTRAGSSTRAALASITSPPIGRVDLARGLDALDHGRPARPCRAWRRPRAARRTRRRPSCSWAWSLMPTVAMSPSIRDPFVVLGEVDRHRGSPVSDGSGAGRRAGRHDARGQRLAADQEHDLGARGGVRRPRHSPWRPGRRRSGRSRRW